MYMGFKNIFKNFKTDRRIKIAKQFVNKNIYILEIGVHEGKFSELLLNKFQPQKMYLVDPWKYESDFIYKKALYGGNFSSLEGQKILDDRYEKVKLKFQKQIKSGQISLIRKSSDEVFKLFEDNFFDFIYIDGNHTFEYVKADIANSLKKIKDEGVIICDDYGNIGWWKNGVSKAVNQLCNQNIVKKIFVKNSQCVLKKI